MVTAGNPGYTRQKSPGSSTRALAGRRKPIGQRHSESRVRENCMHGSEGGAVNARPYPYQINLAGVRYGVRRLVAALVVTFTSFETTSSPPSQHVGHEFRDP